jgi:Fur family transcriptional regulator, peroxide stress response regulator
MALRSHRDHPTADQIYEELAPRLPGLSRTTVYRVLEIVVRLGLASRVAHPGAAARFDPETGPHHHLLCTGCGRLIDLDPGEVPPVSDPTTLPESFEIQDASVYFRGTCAPCRDTAAGTRRPRSLSGRRKKP